MELPLFPIGEVVLLPGMGLPIYVFEPRYRELLGRIRQSGEAIGIPCVLPENVAKGNDLDARLARVGTLAHLTQVNYNPDGTAEILVVGGERYSILEIDHLSQPYSVATVELLPLEPCDLNWVKAVAREVVERFVQKVKPRLGDVMGEIPEDLVLRASFVAANLGLPEGERYQVQRVLEAKTLLERFEMLSGLVGIEQRQLN
jgi:Lon protease-like protein